MSFYIRIFFLSFILLIYIYFKSIYFVNLRENNNKNIKKLKIFLKCFILTMLIFLVYKNIEVVFDYYKSSHESNEEFVIYEEKEEKENEFYKKVINLDYKNQNYKIPYIFEGFKHIEGEWNNGFVIEDESGNQYVWVPCSNIENNEVIKLDRYNFESPCFISKDECWNTDYEEFINSALENGGFYISRFEIGKENEKPVSKFGVEILKNITRIEAINIIDTMYKNTDINCEMINGYAYDTTLEWIKKNNKIELIVNNFSEENEIKTGRKKYNNIYDLTDNVMELTSENSYDTIILRGVLYDEYKKMNDRWSMRENESFFSVNGILAFRTILYK